MPKRLVYEPYPLESFSIKHTIITGGVNTLRSYQTSDHFSEQSNYYPVNLVSPLYFLHGFSQKNHMESIYKYKNYGAPLRFIFLAGSGLVHKGLDLIIEAFRKVKSDSYRVDIFSHYESDFFSAFAEHSLPPNFTFHGFYSLNSPFLQQYLYKAHYCLLPSCSEGQSTSLLAALHYGVVPIASPFCGVDFSCGSFGVCDLTVESLVSSLESVFDLTKSTFLDYSQASVNYIQRNHTSMTYSSSIAEVVSSIIGAS
jgi:glycosyltransferase involved in cell wall biosynthesis